MHSINFCCLSTARHCSRYLTFPMIEMCRSALSNIVASSYLWLGSPSSVASGYEEPNF